jgi:hypothetical protein
MASDKHENEHERQRHEQQERERQERERQHPPGQDHPPHRDAPQREAAPRQPTAAEREAADKAAAELRETRAFGSIGAQIILDYNGDGGLGARGGAGGTIEENTAARDAHYIALGLNPAAVSGPPPSMEARKARQEALDAQVEANARISAAHAEPGAGAASRVSSLAAGLITEPADVPIAPPPPQAEGGAQAAHK